MSTKPQLPRTWQQVALDLLAMQKRGRFEKRQLGGITPKTAQQMRTLFAEADAIQVIEWVKTSGSTT